jgi:isopenicillin-N N-acyltransferase-like protein
VIVMGKSLQVVDLEGSPYEMGLGHGQALREAAHAFLEGITEVHRNNNVFVQADREALISFCLRNLGFVR